MKRILIAVGCDRYDTLDDLCGAEHDAVAIHKQLVGCDYDADASTLLLSPTVDRIINAMSALPFGSADIDTLTFFFAGHGGEKAGTYYLCARDTDPSRLSTDMKGRVVKRRDLSPTRWFVVVAERGVAPRRLRR